jgi:glycosyltransferase involved in cell wall biosynthesis
VQRERCGVTVAPENPVELAAAMETLADMPVEERSAMGARGRAAYVRELGSTAGAERLERMLSTAAGRRHR